MANSVDSDQTAPLSTLFAQICLSENLESLQYSALTMGRAMVTKCRQ